MYPGGKSDFNSKASFGYNLPIRAARSRSLGRETAEHEQRRGKRDYEFHS